MRNASEKVFKTVLVLLSCIALILIIACKTGTDEPKTVLDDIYSINQELMSKLDDVETAEDFAALLNEHTKKMSGLAPKMKLFQEKYPELVTGGGIPSELKPLLERNRAFDEELGKKAAPLMEKYENDPLVNEALSALVSLTEHGSGSEKQAGE